jgi:phosphatidylglycerophosphate synthase
MIPNIITSLRIALLIPLYACLVAGTNELRWSALAVLALAGLTDVADGYLARKLNQTSRSGAMLDLIADRLLILVTVTAMIAARLLSGPFILAGLVLMARCLVVASLNEALPGRLDITVSPLEKVKITFQFAGFALLIAPPLWPAGGALAQSELGAIGLAISAGLVCITLADYCSRAVSSFRQAKSLG